jgi:hypothetical protein
MTRPLRFVYPGAVYHIMAGERASDPFHFRVVADYILLNPAQDGHGRRAYVAYLKKRAANEGEAERIVVWGMVALGLLDGKGKPVPARKGDPRKVVLASVVKSHTSVGNEWIAKRLEMGHNRLRAPDPTGQ